MAREILIGVDAGTSLIKAVAFDSIGQQVASAARRNLLDYRNDGGVEQDMDRTWEDTVSVINALTEKLPNSDHVVGLAITGQGDGTWLMDGDGRAVAPAWLWLDGRAGPLVQELRQSSIGQEVFAITGTGLNQSNQSSQLAFMKRHMPDVPARAATAFHCKDWLYYRLTGERATDIAEGTFTFGNYGTGGYDDRILELLDITEYADLRPPMIDGTGHAGRLTSEASEAIGLPAGTPVVLAPVDILVTALGGGLYEPQRSIGLTILGSTGIHMRLFRSLDEIHPRNQAGYVIPFMVPGTWAGMMSNMAATLNFDWMVELAESLMNLGGNAASGREELICMLDRLAGDAAPGRLIYHPFICDAGERGPFVDSRVRAQFLGLSSGAGPGAMMRAMYEALGFAARDCYEAMSHVPEEIRLVGGAGRSGVIRRILAATMNRPVREVYREEAGAAGAAMIAAVCLGIHENLQEASKVWVSPHLGDLEAPESTLAATYEELFPLYRKGYQAMFDFWAEFDAFRRRQSS